MGDKKHFDVVVIGGGPGGYVAAIKAAQQAGKTVALIEKKDLGGTCLNVGCIPTKTLIAGAELYRKIKRAKDYGIEVKEVTFDFGKMTKRKDDVVEKIRTSLEGLIKQNSITILRGHGKLLGNQEVKVLGEDPCIITAGAIILATGSEPRDMSSFPFDYKKIHSSTSLLELKKLPKKLVIVGGGVIGCEAACLYSAFGVEVVILEMLPHLISPEGPEMGKHLRAALETQGIKILTGVLVEGIATTKQGVSVRIKDHDPLESEMALVAVGRKINSDGIGLEAAGVVTLKNGAIPVNASMETNIPDIYAIGDVTGQWWLAHVASHAGIVAAQNAVGLPSVMHYNAIPSVIFTSPELASVGMTLEKAKAAGYDAVIGKFPFQALGKSQATMDTEGFTQVVVDKATSQILGAQVMGHDAAALVAEMALAIQNELTVECVADTIHAHPTVAEAWLEAALSAADMPIHLPPKRKKRA